MCHFCPGFYQNSTRSFFLFFIYFSSHQLRQPLNLAVWFNFWHLRVCFDK